MYYSIFTLSSQRPESLEAWKKLLAGNARFAKGLSGEANVSPERREELVPAQAPMATVLTCADSRVAPELLFDAGLGELFVVRNPGVIPTPSMLAGVEFSICM